MSKYGEVIERQNQEILRKKREDCEYALKNWGIPLEDEHTEELIDVAFLMHLEASEAPEAIRRVRENAAGFVEEHYKKSRVMQEEMQPYSGTVDDVINYLVLNLDGFKMH